MVPKKAPRYRPSKVWRELTALKAENASEFCNDPEKPWFEVKYMVSTKSNDQCCVRSWVFAATGTAEPPHGGSPVLLPNPIGVTISGRIVELLAPDKRAAKGVAVIEVYHMLEKKHPVFGMPRLAKATTDSGTGLVIVSTEVCLRPLHGFVFASEIFPPSP